MSIKVGVYDFFTHLIGGSFLLAIILYILQRLLPLPIDIANLSSTQFLILGTIGYVLGYVATPISSHYWYRFFVPKELYQNTIQALNKQIPQMEVNLDEMDWYTLIAFIKKQNIDMAGDIEQYNAISIMLRSTSFGLLLFSITFIVDFFLKNYVIGFLFLSIVCFILSVILIRESVTYHTYFFRSIYQSVVALIIQPEQLSVKIRARKKDDSPNK